MRHLADKPLGSASREPSVGIERDDITYVFGDLREHPVQIQETCVVRTAQQPVQFMQLAALAFPTHPLALGGVPQASAVQQQEKRWPILGVARVKSANCDAYPVEKRLI